MIYKDKLTGFDALYNRAFAFYTAPVTKFWMHLMMYFIFLVRIFLLHKVIITSHIALLPQLFRNVNTVSSQGFHTYALLIDMRYIAPFDLTKLAWTEAVVWIW